MGGFFLTGTNTGVGKSYVGALIAGDLLRAGLRVGVYKPAESGCQGLEASDARRLWEAAGAPGDLAHVCPQRFAAPLAPPQAAALEGRRVDRQLLRTGLTYWQARSDWVLVEGAGGLMSPLSDEDYNADLAADLGLPLVIVADNALGVIGATLQTIITARAVAPRLPIAGVVLNQSAAHPDDASIDRNAEQLRHHCDVPLLATVSFGQTTFDPAVAWHQLAP
jgi:dethiobiotin synthetase